MGSVLGVSVGASAVRMARPEVGGHDGYPDSRSFAQQAVDVTQPSSENLAAESIGVASASGETIAATAIAYRNAEHAKAIDAAMAREQLHNYHLVPETSAILEYLESTGDIQGFSTLAIYDLGSSNLTVSVVDTRAREVRYLEQTSDVSGDYFDSLIREHQVTSGRLDVPQTQQDVLDQNERCRGVKEQLSTTPAAALPTDSGLVLLSREHFDSLIVLAVEASARMTRDVIVASEQPVQAVVLVGGGSRIPLVQNVMRAWMGMPVIIPDAPEAVASRGAALLARPVRPPRQQAAQAAVPQSTPAWLAANTGKEHVPNTRKREISGAGLAVTSLAVIAAIGLALGYGGQMLERGTGSSTPDTSESKPAPRTTTSDPSIAVAPLPPPTSASPAPAPEVAAPPQTAEQRQRQAETQDDGPAYRAPAPPPGPAPVIIPGLPPIIVPTLPPPPPPPPLPRIDLPPLPQLPRFP